MRQTLGPLFLILLCPSAAILVWHTNFALGGSLASLVHLFQEQGIFPAIYSIWSPVFFGSTSSWTIIACFAISQLLLMHLVPGKRFEGPITPNGNVPIYKANGVACFLITFCSFCSNSRLVISRPNNAISQQPLS